MAKEKKTVEKQTETQTAELEAIKAEFEALKAENDKLTKEKEAEHDLLMRTAAEYDNYRRRTNEEMTRKRTDGKAEAVEKLLSVTDSIRMAMNTQCDEEDPMYKGLSLISKQMNDTLVSLGVTEIDTSIPFDPNLHNAVMHVDDEEKGEGEIVEVFVTGYKMGDRVLRYAMVKVAN